MTTGDPYRDSSLAQLAARVAALEEKATKPAPAKKEPASPEERAFSMAAAMLVMCCVLAALSVGIVHGLRAGSATLAAALACAAFVGLFAYGSRT